MNSPINNSGNVLASMWMSSTFLGDLITLNSPEEMAQRLCEQLRELTGAKTVAFLQHTDSQKPCEAIYVCPPRRMALFEDGKLSTLCPSCHPGPIPINLAELSPDDPLSEKLKKTPFENLLRLPIHRGDQHMGSFIIADLPDLENPGEILSIMEFLGPTIGLTIQNGIDRRELQKQRDTLEAQVAARTTEIEQAGKDINASRLAALNMMEDAISTKDQAEKSEERYRMLFENMPSGFALHEMIYDEKNKPVDYRFIQVNPAFETLTGLTKTEVIGRTVKEVLPATEEYWIELYAKVVETGQPQIYQNYAEELGKYFSVRAFPAGPNRFAVLFADITEMKKQEKALQASEEMMRHSQSVAHICSYSTNLNVVDLNESQWVCSPEFYTLFGIDETYPHTIEGWAGFIHPDYVDELIAYHESVVKEKTSFNKEYKIIRINDGAERWVHGTGELEFDEKGTAIRMHGAIQDITDRKEAQRALEESRQLLRIIIDTVPDRVWWKDLDSRYVGCNIHVAHDAGFDHPDQVIGKTDFDMIWAGEAERFLANDRSVIESGMPRLTDDKFQVLPDGRTRWINVSQFPLEDTNGKIIGTLGTYADVTERHEAQQELEDSRQLLRNIIDTIPDRVWWKDLDSRYVGCNIHVAHDAGFDHPDQVIGKTDFDMIWAGEAERFIANDLEVIESGQPRLYDNEFQVLADGKTRWIAVTQVPLKDTKGKIIGTLGTYSDVTERRQMQEAIEKQVLALTRPLEDTTNITFDELFNMEDIQRIQDEFAEATGVASIITTPDGVPITEPSNFTELCSEIIRKTKKGCSNCFKSDAVIGRVNPYGPIVQPCLSGGLWDAGAGITVGGKHIANWLIGQVRDETQTEENMLAYAREIGADEKRFIEAFRKVPSMSLTRFEEVAKALYTLANQLSTSAYQNIQQARFISDQKKAEAELRESQENLKAMWDMMDVGIALIDAETQEILDVNPAIINISGHTREALVGQSCHNLLCPAAIGECPVKDLGKNIEHAERELLHADGHLVEVEKTVKLINMSGRVVYLETLIDISARKEAEAGLLRLSTAIDQSPETVVITDREGVIQYVNPAFTEITGYTREEALGQNPRVLKSGVHDEAFYTDMWECLLRGEVWEGQIINKRKDDVLFTEDASIAPVRDPNGDITNFVAVKRDITQELLREEQMQQVQKMEAVGQLAGGIAHDFNNILQAILGFSELLLMTLDVDAEQPRTNVLEIQKAAQHAADLTRQLLAFSRKQTTAFESLNLNNAIRNSLSFAHSIIGENIEIETDLEPDLHPVSADSRQMERTILNMAINARDAMPKGGVLRLKTENISFVREDALASAEIQEGEFICLIISDTGTGIQSDIIEHIFEPFFSTKPPGQGTGLGLAAIYGIIKEHKGWINVYSEPDQGTTFKIFLPASLSDLPQEETVVIPRKTNASERILIVEDDAAYQSLSLNTLEKAGYLVTIASTAEEAEALFDKENGQFGLLFTDVILPDKKGTDLAAALLKKNPDLRVLLCSSYPADRIKTSKLDRKNLFFLEKPFSVVTLLKLVNQMFTRQP